MTATMRAGTIVSFDSGASTAVVRMDDSLSTFLEDVPVGEHIDDAEVTADRRCLVAFVDPNNPTDAVVFAVWD